MVKTFKSLVCKFRCNCFLLIWFAWITSPKVFVGKESIQVYHPAFMSVQYAQVSGDVCMHESGTIVDKGPPPENGESLLLNCYVGSTRVKCINCRNFALMGSYGRTLLCRVSLYSALFLNVVSAISQAQPKCRQPTLGRTIALRQHE